MAILGFAGDVGETKLFNDKTWFSLYKMKEYKQSFNGNVATGGKVKHAKFWSNTLDLSGKALGAYQAYDIYNQWDNGEIGASRFLIENTVNTYSTFGGIYGSAVGVGWEIGRAITRTDWYHRNLYLKVDPGGRDGLISTYK
ncbi:MAG: hypothetical protein IPL98_05745 [Saprospiraceae bacterium]|nr:hypothetical protein [Saprospiraceae bacterium]